MHTLEGIAAAGLAAVGLGFWLSPATESATEISSVAAPTTVSQISIWEIHNQAHLDSPTNRGSKSDLHCERADNLRASLIRLPPLSAGERSGDCLANSASATSHAGAARCFSLDVLDAKLGGPARREFIELRSSVRETALSPLPRVDRSCAHLRNRVRARRGLDAMVMTDGHAHEKLMQAVDALPSRTSVALK